MTAAAKGGTADELNWLISQVAEAAEKAGQAAGAPAEPPEPEIKILIARDRMEAVAVVTIPPGGRQPQPAEVEAKMIEAGIRFGVVPTAAAEAVKYPGRPVTCARGQPPVNGEDAVVKILIDMENKGRPVELENGRVDFKNLNMFTIVRAGHPLAEKTPATPGTPGRDVLGLPVPPKPGRDRPFPAGKNTRANGLLLEAAIDGQVVLQGGRLSVLPSIEIRGDVDFSTGNIDFLGNVVIYGSVQTGFTVKASGAVDIHGFVFGGTVEGKRVAVRQGIQGMNRGYIRAAEDVLALFVENACIEAGSSLIVSRSIIHSRVRAGKRVVAESRQGLIVGGRISAGEEIRAHTIGRPAGAATEIEIGVDPEFQKEYTDLAQQLPFMEDEFVQLGKSISLLEAASESGLSEEQKQRLLQMIRDRTLLGARLEAMRSRLRDMEVRLQELAAARLKVDYLYPGTRIKVGDLVETVKDPVRNAVVRMSGGAIIFEPIESKS